MEWAIGKNKMNGAKGALKLRVVMMANRSYLLLFSPY
jgi:hypothetical protein